MEVRQRRWSFNLDNRNYIVVRNIASIGCGITMRTSNNNVVDGLNATWIHHTTLVSGGFNQDQENGIIINGNNNEVRNSSIRLSTHSLIDLNGTGNKVINNLIENASLSASTYASAIGLTDSTNGLVSHNTVRGSGRMLIYNHGSGGGGNLVQYNDFSRFMLLSSDGGAIYGYAREGQGSEFAYNRFSDCGTGGYNRCGFYIDNQGHDIIAHHNVFFNIRNCSGRLT